MGAEVESSISPLVRLLRLLRILRILRHLRVFTKFHTLLLAIQHSLMPLTWACVLIFALLYVASLVCLNAVSEYLMSGATDPEVVSTLLTYFGTLDEALLTLFMSISGGVSWEVLVNPLMKIHVAYGLFFVGFIACVMLAALNIIAGIFVNDAIERAEKDRDIALQAESHRNKMVMKELHDLFLEFDTDHSGTLTRQEFMDAFDIEGVQARFKRLGVEFDASGGSQVFHSTEPSD